MTAILSRRAAMIGAGALVVAFSLSSAQAAGQDASAPGDLGKYPLLDSWIRIGGDGAVTIFTGKVELGQGLKTALAQLVAEELVVPLDKVQVVTADTALTPNEGYTAGSRSMTDSGSAVQNAAAQARAIIIAAAAQMLQLPEEQLRADAGFVRADDGRRLGYGELVGSAALHLNAAPQSHLIDPGQHQLIGKPVHRVDIPPKLVGGAAFVQDLRLAKMLHGRVVLPPSYGARLRHLDTAAVKSLPGVVNVVQDGAFLGVIAQHEYDALLAMTALQAAAVWDEEPNLPDPQQLSQTLAGLPAQTINVRDDQITIPPGANVIEASYSRPYQMHGSIGPSCAVALFDDGALTVWTHSQGVYPLRGALAELTGLAKEKVRCIHHEGSGCYGHNGADDAAADAALLAMAVPGSPVRVQWMREQEHTWEPYGSAMVTRVRAAVSPKHQIITWDYAVRSSTHSTRPFDGNGGAGNLLAARHRAQPIPAPPPHPIPLPAGGGDRNALPLYIRLPQTRVIYEFLPAMPLRVSALRSLGAYMNIFSIESFMDELATLAQRDPIDFRLDYLDDQRARDVINKAAERFGWSGFGSEYGRGRGFAFARYENSAAYLAVAVEVAVDRESGRVRLLRAAAAIDSGQAINPDGIKNQVEGGILQSASWTLYESVAFDRTRILSRDWSSYPIMRFSNAPRSVEVAVIDRPGSPYLGTGEAAQGPTAAAIANAINNAVGVRLRDLPLTAARVKAAIGI